MPTYGYRCPNGHDFEVIHAMGGSPPTACAVCGAAPVVRVFYPISVSFTGTGFYATDYGQGEQKPEAGEQKSDAAPTVGDDAKASANDANKTDKKSSKKSEPD